MFILVFVLRLLRQGHGQPRAYPSANESESNRNTLCYLCADDGIEAMTLGCARVGLFIAKYSSGVCDTAANEDPIQMHGADGDLWPHE